MITLEELDGHKKGMTEVARNARQVSRDARLRWPRQPDGASTSATGMRLAATGHREAGGKLFFQTSLLDVTLPASLPQGKADNQILGVVQALREQQQAPRDVVLVSKDINMRVKARALGLPGRRLPERQDAGRRRPAVHRRACRCRRTSGTAMARPMESWQQGGHTFYRISGPVVPQLLINQFVYFESPGAQPLYAKVTEITRQDRGAEDAERLHPPEECGVGRDRAQPRTELLP